jgi:Spy/CpxP family protein refolding chaperone
MKNIRVYLLLTCLATCTYTLLGQTSEAPRTPPTPVQMAAHRLSRLTTLLSLSEAQQTQATTLFTTEATSLSGLRQSMRTARAALKSAIQNNDVATITAQSQAIGSLTGQEMEARAVADAGFTALLTPEQQAKYQQLERGPGGGGGFHRPPSAGLGR